LDTATAIVADFDVRDTFIVHQAPRAGISLRNRVQPVVIGSLALLVVLGETRWL
jgi:hypothetical protein